MSSFSVARDLTIAEQLETETLLFGHGLHIVCTATCKLQRGDRRRRVVVRVERSAVEVEVRGGLYNDIIT
jgi:hypothetical protein